MSCWVVPAIAAELWGVPLGNVLMGVRDGSIASRQEHGFVFVDVAPDSHRYYRPRRPGEPPPPTYVPVTRPGECEAGKPGECLAGERGDRCEVGEPQKVLGFDAVPVLMTCAPEVVAEDAELPPLDDEEDDSPLPPRDAIRAAVARQRRRPLAA